MKFPVTFAARWARMGIGKLPYGKRLNVVDVYISELEKCLACFMLVAKIRGVFLDDSMCEWAVDKLKGGTRTPVEVFRSISKET